MSRTPLSRSTSTVLGALVGTLLAFAAPSIGAQQTATQTVVLRVVASSEASMQNAIAAVPMHSARTVTATYGVVTNESNQKISASLDRPMPQGTSLRVTMAVPPGAMTAPATTLGTSATDVVTAIPVSAASGLPVNYVVQGAASTDAKAGKRVVTYTFTAGI